MKTVLVTGGAGGIGEAICRKFAANGYFVGVGYLSSEKKAREIAAETGGAAIEIDVRDIRSVRKATNEFFAYYKKIDALVNNAGVALPIKTLLDCSEEEFDKIFSVNVKGVFNCTKEALPRLIESKGSIVNVSSMWGICGASCEALYSSTKAAIIGFTKSIAKEYAAAGVRVNAVAPGFIDTKMNKSFGEEDRKEILGDIPLGRFGTPEDVAEAAYYLADKGSFVTGEVLNVSGGEVI